MRARLAAVLLAATAATPPAGAQESQQGGALAPFTLSVLDLKTVGALPPAQVRDGGGCKGGNVPPHLAWAAVPPGTKGLALTMLDTTAGFWHWALYDLPPDARTFEAGQAPSSAKTGRGAKTGRNDYGEPGYGGACPPPGKPHSYRFTAWAVPDATLPLAAGAADQAIGAYLAAHALGTADLVFSYGR